MEFVDSGEIVKKASDIRGKLGWVNKSLGLDPEKAVFGACCHNGHFEDLYGGRAWRSWDCKFVPDQVYPGHSVAVVPVSEDVAFVMDICVGRHPVGVVEDYELEENVRSVLGELYDAPEDSWQRSRVISVKDLG